jgi:aquaporin related protein
LDEQAQYVRIALAFGLIVATMAQTIGHVSGCHINPAITAGLVAGAKVGLVKGLLYVVVQCLGGLTGAGLLKLVVAEVRGSDGLGTTSINKAITYAQGFGIEFVITMILVLVVFGAAADENNDVKGSALLAIRLSITVCHLFAIPLTGSSMNPARSLGSNVVAGSTDDLWVYLLGPTLGGVTAGLLYQLVFAAPGPAKTAGVIIDEIKDIIVDDSKDEEMAA